MLPAVGTNAWRPQVWSMDGAQALCLCTKPCRYVWKCASRCPFVALWVVGHAARPAAEQDGRRSLARELGWYYGPKS